MISVTETHRFFGLTHGLINKILRLNLISVALYFFSVVLCGISFFLAKEINKAGRKIKLVNVAMINVSEVSHPSALVPPKLLKQKIAKPVINTREV